MFINNRYVFLRATEIPAFSPALSKVEQARSNPQGENSLTFETGVLMSSNFLKPPNNQTNFSKTQIISRPVSEKRLDTKKMAWTIAYQNCQTPNNLAYPKSQTTYSTFWTSKFQTPNNFAYPKLQTKISTLAPPFNKSRSSPPGVKSNQTSPQP